MIVDVLVWLQQQVMNVGDEVTVNEMLTLCL